MQALTHVHIRNHKLTTKEFFRVCYYWKFSHDITDLALANDAKQYEESGTVPKYVTEFLIAKYGTS